MASARRTWLTRALAYGLSGALASALSGAALGALGGLLLPGDTGRLGVLAALALAAVTVAQDMGWIRLPLIQPRRQTRDVWIHRYGALLAAVLWGFDIGLLVFTRFTFAGVWLLILSALLLQNTVFGAVLVVAYWIGRAASVWVGPLLLENAVETPEMLDEINNRYYTFRAMHLLGVGLLLITLLPHL